MAGPSYHGRTHLPGGTDPIPGLTLGSTGPGLNDILNTLGLAGLWKLAESSGTTAADSSGNGNDMTVRSGYVGPTWGQAAGPPGTTSAEFLEEPAGSNAGTSFHTTIGTGLTDNFSAGVWVYPTLDQSAEMIGQGTSPHANAGWSLGVSGGGAGKKWQITADMAGQALSNNAITLDAWALVGFSWVAGTATMYVNGLAQSATLTATPTASGATWLGNDGFSTAGSHGSAQQLMSWAFITDTPISGAEWLEIYEAGTTGGDLPSGYVWTADGSGGASWQPPTIEVTY